MSYHFERMTEKQWQALHKLIHEAEWHTINPHMSEQEASQRISEAIRQNEAEREEYCRRKHPSPPFSLRRRGENPGPPMTDEEFAAQRKETERRFAEFQAARAKRKQEEEQAALWPKRGDQRNAPLVPQIAKIVKLEHRNQQSYVEAGECTITKPRVARPAPQRDVG